MSDKKAILETPVTQSDATSSSASVFEDFSCNDKEDTERLKCLRDLNGTQVENVLNEVSRISFHLSVFICNSTPYLWALYIYNIMNIQSKPKSYSYLHDVICRIQPIGCHMLMVLF